LIEKDIKLKERKIDLILVFSSLKHNFVTDCVIMSEELQLFATSIHFLWFRYRSATECCATRFLQFILYCKLNV